MARSGMLEVIDRLAAAVIDLEQRCRMPSPQPRRLCLNDICGRRRQCRLLRLGFDCLWTAWHLRVRDCTSAAGRREAYLKLGRRTMPRSVETLEQQRLDLLQIVQEELRHQAGQRVCGLWRPGATAPARIPASVASDVSASTATAGAPRALARAAHAAAQVQARATQLYPSPDMIPLEHFDVEARGVMTREQSAFSDTVREVASMFTREQAALRHLVTKWERGHRRLVLKTAHDALRHPLLGVAYALPDDTYGLVIQLPRDVQAAASAVAEPERRRMQLIADRSQPSALKQVFKGLKEVEATFLALSVYCEFWTSELLLRSGQPPLLAEQARSFALASHWAAAARAEACGQLVLDTTAQSPVGFFDADDPIMQATQAGRDARILGRRMGGLDTSADANDVRWRSRSGVRAVSHCQDCGQLERRGHPIGAASVHVHRPPSRRVRLSKGAPVRDSAPNLGVRQRHPLQHLLRLPVVAGRPGAARAAGSTRARCDRPMRAGRAAARPSDGRTAAAACKTGGGIADRLSGH